MVFRILKRKFDFHELDYPFQQSLDAFISLMFDSLIAINYSQVIEVMDQFNIYEIVSKSS